MPASLSMSSSVTHVAPVSIVAAGHHLRSGRTTAARLVEQCLARIDAFDGELHAFVAVTRERARREAREADDALAKGHDRGPLHGIPVAIKDVIDLAGVPTRAHSLHSSPLPAARDAAVVSRLVAAGAVIVGKTTTHEHAFSVPEDTAAGMAARNPWDTSRFAGGSSSGNAVAIAAGMALGAIGTDTAGSVRSPAALCGIAGFKPVRQALPLEGVMPLSRSLDTVGLMAADPASCQVMVDTLTGSHLFRPRTCAPDLSDLRIGWARELYVRDFPASSEVIAAIDRAVDRWHAADARIVPMEWPGVLDWHRAGMTTLLAEAWQVHGPCYLACPRGFGPALRGALRVARRITAEQQACAMAQCQALASRARAAMADVDVVVTAIQRAPAGRIDSIDRWGFARQPSLGLIFNVADMPALAVPIGLSREGLPLALQIAARPDRLDALWRVAGALPSPGPSA